MAQDLDSTIEPRGPDHVAALGSPSQPRDDHGRWSDGPGGGSAPSAGVGESSGGSGYTPGGSWRGRGKTKPRTTSPGAAGTSDGRSPAQKKRQVDQRETADVAEKRARSHEAKAKTAGEEAAKKRQELDETRDSIEPKRRRAEELEESYQGKLKAHEDAESRFDDENVEDVPEARRKQLGDEADQARGEMRAAKRAAAEADKSHRAAERRADRLEDEYDAAREEAISRRLNADTARNRAEIEREHADLLERPHAEYSAEARKRATAAKRDVAKANAAADAAERDLGAARKAAQEAGEAATRGQHATQADRERAFDRAKAAEDARRSAEERSMAADNDSRLARTRAKYWAEAARGARSLKPIDGDGDGRVREAERTDKLSSNSGEHEDTMSIIETLAVGEDVPLQLVNGQAPRELRLFKKGENPSTKGMYVFDDVAAKAVMSTYERMGRKWVSIDYDHGSLQRNPVDPSRSARSAGKASLELRDGELWATNIRWSPAAKASIEAEEWPSISPAFAHGEDRRPTWLMNFGLTGNPALHGPAELIAASALRAIFDPTDADDQEAIASANTGVQPARTEAPATEEARMKKRTPAEVAEFFGITEDEAKVWLAAANGEPRKVLSAVVPLSVGLTADSDERLVIERLSALAGAERRIFAALGVKTEEDALGAISGLQRAKESAATLAKDLADLQTKQVRSEVDALLSAGKDAKKLTPAEIADDGETSLRTTALSMKEKGPSWLKAHIAQRPVIEVLNTTYTPPDTKPKTDGDTKHKVDVGGKTYAQLSYMEKDELARRDPEQFEKLREAHLNALPSGQQYPLPDNKPGSFFRDLPG
ncbi:phage protease [Sorangium sp. So ce388]|uniref:phage protease n=1 Tax=Sorangium sp. So ce388 TaxID=3133309 RepID=UPI003F5C7BE7